MLPLPRGDFDVQNMSPPLSREVFLWKGIL